MGRGSEEEGGQCAVVMSDLSKCAVCKGDASRGYVVSAIPEDYTLAFCSRVHLVEFIAPELSKAIAVKQWVPTPDEEARMTQ